MAEPRFRIILIKQLRLEKMYKKLEEFRYKYAKYLAGANHMKQNIYDKEAEIKTLKKELENDRT